MKGKRFSWTHTLLPTAIQPLTKIFVRFYTKNTNLLLLHPLPLRFLSERNYKLEFEPFIITRLICNGVKTDITKLIEFPSYYKYDA